MSDEVKQIIEWIKEDIEFYDNPPSYEPSELYEKYQAKKDYAEDILMRIMKSFASEEEAQRMATQAAKQVCRGGFVVNREVE